MDLFHFIAKLLHVRRTLHIATAILHELPSIVQSEVCNQLLLAPPLAVDGAGVQALFLIECVPGAVKAGFCELTPGQCSLFCHKFLLVRSYRRVVPAIGPGLPALLGNPAGKE